MKFVIFDTETTGLNGEAIQMAMIVLDENLKIESFDSFYCDTDCVIEKGATNVHGLTNEMVHKLSGGKYFEDYVLGNPRYKKLFFEEDVVFPGYNVLFDLKIVNNSLINTGHGLITDIKKYSDLKNNPDAKLRLVTKTYNPIKETGGAHWFDLMEYARNRTGMIKGLNLAKAVDLLVRDIDVKTSFDVVSKKFNLQSGKSYHDASYDAFCTMLLFYEFIKNPM